MNRYDLQREAESFARRGLGSVTDLDDLLIAAELRRMGERRLATDAADGFNKMDDGEE